MRIIVIIAILVFFMVSEAWAADSNYTAITELLQINDCPYPVPANLDEANSNVAYLVQNIKAILQSNHEAWEKVKRALYAEKVLKGDK